MNKQIMQKIDLQMLRSHLANRLKVVVVAGAMFAFSMPAMAQCGTTNIDISTGLNANTVPGVLLPYSFGSLVMYDPWWEVTMVPSNTIGYVAPQCARLADQSIITGTGWGSTVNSPTAGSPVGSRYISFISQCGEPPYGSLPSGGTGGGFLRQYSFTSGPSSLPVRFTRKFFIDGTTPQIVTIKMAGYGDDIIFMAVDATPGIPLYVGSTPPPIPSPSAPYYLYYACGTSTTLSPMSTSVNYMLSPGAHTVDVDLYDISGIVVGINLIGSIKCSFPVLEKSACYGMNSCTNKGGKIGAAQSVNGQTEAGNALYQNVPNPSRGQTRIGYSVQQITNSAYITILDINGREVGRYPIAKAGQGKVNVDLNSLEPGLYMYALVVDGHQLAIKKMTVIN